MRKKTPRASSARKSPAKPRATASTAGGRERARTYWATRYRRDMPCLWGGRASAVSGCEPGEDVVLVRVEVVRLAVLTARERRRLAQDCSPF
jgi:hypothetical protein